MNTILLCTIVVCGCLQIVNGSCLSYGHSCWGAHGKRSGQLKKQGLPNDQLELAERWALIKLNSDIFPNKGTIQLNSKTNSAAHDEKDENALVNNQNINLLNNSEESDGLIIPQKQQQQQQQQQQTPILASLLSRQRENNKRNNFGYDYDDDGGSIMMMADDINNNNNDIARFRDNNNNNNNMATAENSRIFRMMNPILKKLMH